MSLVPNDFLNFNDKASQEAQRKIESLDPAFTQATEVLVFAQHRSSGPATIPGSQLVEAFSTFAKDHGTNSNAGKVINAVLGKTVEKSPAIAADVIRMLIKDGMYPSSAVAGALFLSVRTVKALVRSEDKQNLLHASRLASFVLAATPANKPAHEQMAETCKTILFPAMKTSAYGQIAASLDKQIKAYKKTADLDI